MYKVKEMFYSLQGEGARAGRAAVFCRFSKCNLWNGRERDRKNATCSFCDTDILGTDGQNGGEFSTAETLAEAIIKLWPQHDGQARPYVIFTGGEPLLQLDQTLVDTMHANGFEVAIETNGTLPAPDAIDWVCVSPKGDSEVIINQCNELKLVYPQSDAPPEKFNRFSAEHFFLSPRANPNITSGDDPVKAMHTQLALDYCLANPQWRLSLQLHKLLHID